MAASARPPVAGRRCSRRRTAPAATAARPLPAAAPTTRRTSARSSRAAASVWAARLTGIDIPTLRDVWATAPVPARRLGGDLGRCDPGPQQRHRVRAGPGQPRGLRHRRSAVRSLRRPDRYQKTGTGLVGAVLQQHDFVRRRPCLQRTEAVNFNWGSASPGPGVNNDKFSVRWTGTVEAIVDRQLPVPDRHRRRRALVGQRRRRSSTTGPTTPQRRTPARPLR